MEQEKKDQLHQLGVDLANFLQLADISDEEKASWEALVPEMDEEQLQKLSVYLYAKIPEEVKETAQFAREEMQRISDEHDAREKEIEQKASAKLDLLESQLNDE